MLFPAHFWFAKFWKFYFRFWCISPKAIQLEDSILYFQPTRLVSFVKKPFHFILKLLYRRNILFVLSVYWMLQFWQKNFADFQWKNFSFHFVFEVGLLNTINGGFGSYQSLGSWFFNFEISSFTHFIKYITRGPDWELLTI